MKNKIIFKKLLKGTRYENKAEMVQRVVDRNGQENLQNLPRMGLTGVDVYDLLAVINEKLDEGSKVVEKPKNPPKKELKKEA